jgi:hypothetical protein
MNDQPEPVAVPVQNAADDSLSPMAAIRSGAHDARVAAASLRVSLARGVYRATYSVSYSVVYTALTLTAWIPACGAAVEGIRDGATAAATAFKTQQKESADVGAMNQPEPGLASA